MLGPVEREVMAQLFAAIPDEMGALLVRSAVSPNIRERRDCSAAIFSAGGELVAQAAHIPVHLGAMPDAVAAIRASDPPLEPGDVYLLNDPYRGGTHLPDITVIEAVGARASRLRGRPPVAYAAVRAHHADVGGARPGSMPPVARTLSEEGVVIPPTKVVARGRRVRGVLEDLAGRMRERETRLLDFAAQLAAAHRGAERWLELLERYGAEFLDAAVADLLSYAERRTRAALALLPAGTFRASDHLEGDGITDALIPLAVELSIGGGALRADFAGTAGAAAGNVNCPLSVTRSAVLFVTRCLVPPDVPTNGGVMRCVEVRAPEGCLVNARPPAAVAAGNVETSQRIADLLFAALAQAGAPVLAQGQGTMNNVIVGAEGWTYYETIGGGQGASAAGPGPSAVHVGMSNTLNTPIEALEMELPIRVERYAVRRVSGGRVSEAGSPGGWHPGGEGVVRELRVLAPCSLSLITERRRLSPRGIGGGGDGARGRNLVNGTEVGSKEALELAPGDVVTIETPGGGGWGAPPTDQEEAQSAARSKTLASTKSRNSSGSSIPSLTSSVMMTMARSSGTARL